MNMGNYAWVGFLAAVPVALVAALLVLRGYDVTIILKKPRKKNEEE